MGSKVSILIAVVKGCLNRILLSEKENGITHSDRAEVFAVPCFYVLRMRTIVTRILTILIIVQLYEGGEDELTKW